MSEASTRDTVARLMAESRSEEPETPEPEQEAAPEAATEPQEARGAEGEAKEPKKPAAKPSAPVRGPDGEFVKPDAKPPPATSTAEGSGEAAVETPPVSPAAPPLSDLKPPADWTPKAKEKWAAIPREVQEEAIRLHIETKKVLQEAAGHRQAAEAFQRTLAPYEHMFRAAGKNPVEGVGWLVQQYAALQTAPLAQRARIIAGLQRDFVGSDESAIKLLAAELDGTPAQPAPQPLRPEQVQQMVREQLERERQEAAVNEQRRVIAEFEASEPEYLAKVTDQVAAIVKVAQAKGHPITLQLLKEAHQQALRMNPETAAILKQRDDAAEAEKKNAEALKAKAAASGIKNEPAGPSGPAKPRTTREEVAAQFAKQRSGARV